MSDATVYADNYMSTIRDMVAALEVDYDRLEELADIRDALQQEFDSIPECDSVDFDHWVRCQVEITEDELEELEELEEAAQGCTSRDEAEDAILSDALSIETRSGWEPAGGLLSPSEYRIILTMGDHILKSEESLIIMGSLVELG